jgi:hypothetical protein
VVVVLVVLAVVVAVVGSDASRGTRRGEWARGRRHRGRRACRRGKEKGKAKGKCDAGGRQTSAHGGAWRCGRSGSGVEDAAKRGGVVSSWAACLRVAQSLSTAAARAAECAVQQRRSGACRNGEGAALRGEAAAVGVVVRRRGGAVRRV